MGHLAVNVGFLFPDRPYLARFAAARAAGFDAVESAWPLDPLPDVRRALRDAGLRLVLVNMDAGDLGAGDRGFTNDPGARDRWQDAFLAALDFAGSVDCPTVNVLAGNALPGLALDEQQACVRDNLRWAIPRARAAGRTIVVEVLNSLDTPGHLLTRAAGAVALLDELDDPALRFQFDAYHLGLMEPDIVELARSLAPRIGHVQIADAPGRHEPGTGGLDFVGFFDTLAQVRYAGAIGLEYRPAGDTLAGLDWLPRGERAWSDEPFRMGPHGPR